MMRVPFITRSRHARELAVARQQARTATIAAHERDMDLLWSTARQVYGDDGARRLMNAFCSAKYASVPVRYVTGMGPR